MIVLLWNGPFHSSTIIVVLVVYCYIVVHFVMFYWRALASFKGSQPSPSASVVVKKNNKKQILYGPYGGLLTLINPDQPASLHLLLVYKFVGVSGFHQ